MSVMTASESNQAVTKTPRPYLNTRTAEERGFATPQPFRAQERNASGGWDFAFEKLAEWNMSPSRIDEDGLEFPSVEAISKARELCNLQELPISAPSRIVADGEGGLSLKWIHGDQLEAIQIAGDGSAEFVKFVGPRLVIREPIPNLGR